MIRIDLQEVQALEHIAKIITAARMGGAKWEQTFGIMLKGQELGLSPMAALDGIDILNGKPTTAPKTMLALIYSSGELDDIEISATAAEATCTMTRVGRHPHTEKFTMKDAGRMTYDRAGEKPLSSKRNWREMPAVMLKWRAVAACARVVFPDIIQGLYTTDELGRDDWYDEAGDIVRQGGDIELQQFDDEPDQTPQFDPEVARFARQSFPFQSVNTETGEVKLWKHISQPWQVFIKKQTKWNNALFVKCDALGITEDELYLWLNTEHLKEWMGNEWGNTPGDLWYEVILNFQEQTKELAKGRTKDAATVEADEEIPTD